MEFPGPAWLSLGGTDAGGGEGDGAGALTLGTTWGSGGGGGGLYGASAAFSSAFSC
jgi:hypothetical protein